MKKFRLIWLFPLLLAGCKEMPDPLAQLHNIEFPSLPSAQQTDDAKPVSSSQVKEIKAGDIAAWLIEDKTLPLVSVQLVFEGAGSSSDPKDRNGRAMFAAALLDEGAGSLDALAFQKALEDKAIQLSFNTSEDVLIVSLRCLSEHLPAAFHLLEMALNKPRFDPSDIERKRARALSRLRMAKTKPRFLLAKTFNAMAYPDHPYGAQPMGDEESLKQMSQSDLKNYVSEHLTTDRLFVSVTGDIEAKYLKRLVRGLTRLPGKTTAKSPADITMKHQGVTVVEELDIPQSHVLIATPSVERRSERFLAAYILNHIVGGDTLTSVLGTAVRENKGLAYTVSSYLDPMSHSSSFKVRFATRNEEAHQALEIVKKELTKIAKEGVTEEQFENAIDYITGSFVLSLDKNSHYVRYLNTMQRFDLGMDYLQTRNNKMRAVTRAEVNKLAKELFDPKKWLTVVVGKPAKIKSGPKAKK